MPYVPPTLNQLCQYWHPGTAQAYFFTYGVMPDYDDQFYAQLRPWKHPLPNVVFGVPGVPMELVVAKDNPMRWAALSDTEYQYWLAVVELPIDSGMRYFVGGQYDTGFGFSNQYRSFFLMPWYCYEGAIWDVSRPHYPWLPPTPNPLPYISVP